MKTPIAILADPTARFRHFRFISRRIWGDATLFQAAKWAALCLAAAGLIGSPSSLRAATPPGTSLISTIELSPGGSAYSPGQFGVNQATHKLYTLAPHLVNLQPCAAAVINTATGSFVTGIRDPKNTVTSDGGLLVPYGMAVDDSTTAGGNKVYYVSEVGYSSTQRLVLVTGDGATDTIDPNTAVPLPISQPDGNAGIGVNPVNHKVYVSDYYGTVAVVDGPNHSVMKTIQMPSGNGANLIVAIPASNKMLAFPFGPVVLIDSSNDSLTTLPIPTFYAADAAYDSANGRIYAVGQDKNGTTQLIVFDGSGAIVASTTAGVPSGAKSIAVDAAGGKVYVGTPTPYNTNGTITAFSATSLAVVGSFPQGAGKLAIDSTNSSRIYLLDYSSNGARFELLNQVGVLNVNDGSLAKITIGYQPGTVAVNRQTNRTYVADAQAPELLVIDGATDSVSARVTVQPAVNGVGYFGQSYARLIAVSEAVNRVYLPRVVIDPVDGSRASVVDVLDGSTNALITTISVGSPYIYAVAVDDTRRHLLVATQGTMYVYGLDSNALVATAALTGSVFGMVANPATGRIYLGILDGGGHVTVLDGDSYNVVAASVESGAGPVPTAVDQKHNKIYVANTAAGSVANSFTVIDGATNGSQTIDNISSNTGGDAVGAVAVDEVSNTVYVLDNADGSGFPGWVTVYSAANNYSYLGEISVGTAPAGMAFNSTSRQLFVTNENDGTVSVLLNGTRLPPPVPAHGGLSDTYFSVDGYPSGGTVVNGTPLAFLAQQSGTPAGLSVRVQASTTPNDPSSWADLPNGTGGSMVYDVSNLQFVLTSSSYPLSGGVSFRAISSAPAYPDSISNVVGPFNLTSAKAQIGSTSLNFTGNGTIADFYFRATESATVAGMSVRVQASTAPGDEASWNDLSNGNSYMTQSTNPKNPKHFLLLFNNYPTTQGVCFRAIASASGYLDSISNIMGPFDITGLVPPVVTVTTANPLSGSGDGHDSDHPIIVAVDSGAFAATVQSARALKTVQLQVNGATVTEYPGSSDPNAVYIAYFTPTVGDHVYEAVAINDLGARARAGSGAIYVRVIPSQSTAKAERATGADAAAATPAGHTYTVANSGGEWYTPSTWSDENGNPGVPGENDLAIIGSSTIRCSNDVVAGSVTLGVGGVIIGPGVFDVYGTITLLGGSFQNSVLDIFGTANLLNPQDVNFGGELLIFGTLNVHGSAGLTGADQIENNGTINWLTPLQIPLNAATDPAAALRILQAASVTGNGLMTGTLTALIGNDGSSLIGNDGATLISHDGGSIISEHGGGVISNDGGSVVANDGASVVANDGATVLSDHGIGIVASGAGNLQGTARMKTATVAAAPGYTQNGGETNPSACTIVGPVTLNGGVLSGTGIIQGDLTNNGGYISPGGSSFPGRLAVSGNFTQGANGTTIVKRGGPGGGQFDQLQVGGVASLGGKLDIKTINGYTPDVADTFSPLGAGSVSGTFGSVSSNAQVTVNATGLLTSIDPTKPNPTNGQPLNIATRLQIQSGDNVLIAGFIITGPIGSSKKVLIRGIGPSLANFGVAGTIPDPFLELHNPDGSVVTNDNWQEASNAADIPAGFAPGNNLESAIYTTLSPGAYTAIVKGAHDEFGIGLAEVYDFDTASTAKLSNIATRGFVNTGDNVMIGGFIVGGTEPAKILVRAIGPSLTQFGLQGALQATTLELHDSNGGVISNEGWRTTQESEIQATTIPPSNDNEAAILATLAPGNYTAVVRGKNDTTGIAVVEAYNLQ